MTVILSVWDNKHPIHLLSDVLLSIEGNLDKSIALPHLPAGAQKKTFGAYTLSGTAQKTVNYGRTSFLWADRRDIATTVLHEHFAQSEGGTKYVPLSAVINSLDLTVDGRDNVGILTMFCDRPGNVVTCGHNVNHYDVPLGDGNVGKIATIGSGSWDLLENYQATRNRAVTYSLPIDIIHRLAVRTMEPFLNEEESFHHLYGSWFEISRHHDMRFRKIPTAFKFWYRSTATSKLEMIGPLVYSSYVEEDLYITTTMAGPVGGNSDFQTLRIPDPLRRSVVPQTASSETPDQALSFAPELFVQVVVTGQPNGKASVRVRPYFIEGDPLLKVSKVKILGVDRVRAEVSEELYEFMNNMTDEAELTVDPRPFS